MNAEAYSHTLEDRGVRVGERNRFVYDELFEFEIGATRCDVLFGKEELGADRLWLLRLAQSAVVGWAFMDYGASTNQ